MRGTYRYGLKFQGVGDVIHAFSDADWAGDKKDRRSTTGYVLFFGSSPIAWRTMKQASVALSSTEAEYIAMSEATKGGSIRAGTSR